MEKLQGLLHQVKGEQQYQTMLKEFELDRKCIQITSSMNDLIFIIRKFMSAFCGKKITCIFTYFSLLIFVLHSPGVATEDEFVPRVLWDNREENINMKECKSPAQV